MKTIKNIIAFTLLSALIFSCAEVKKDDKTDASESTEITKDSVPKEVKPEPVAEPVAFTYTVTFPSDAELANDVYSTLKNLLANHPELEAEFMKAYGYAVFPKITKVGLGVGGAGGKGLVFEKNAVIGLTKLMQATIGFQAGGQQYMEIILFENKETLDKFTNEKFKFSSEASAVILKSGVSTGLVYHDGIATIVEGEKGAMFEASLGTQKFKFEGNK
jgi:hypothetical protein